MMRIFGSTARRYVYSLKIYKQKSQWNLKLVKIIKSENITIVKYCNSKQENFRGLRYCNSKQ